jgi:hypothetical protein
MERIFESDLRVGKGQFEVACVRRPLKQLKRNPYPGCEVYKVSVMVARAAGDRGVEYSKAVNGRREREGAGAGFEAFPRKWGVRREGSPLVDHKGRVYASLLPGRVVKVWYETDGGDLLSYADVEPHMQSSEKREAREAAARRQAAHQGVEELVKYIDVKLESIAWIRFSGLELRNSENQPLAEPEVAA